MNYAHSNLKLDEMYEDTDENETTFYVSRINPKISWPSNSEVATFVMNGKFRKYRMLTTGDKNVKVVVLKN